MGWRRRWWCATVALLNTTSQPRSVVQATQNNNKHDSHVHKHARERLPTQQLTHHKHSADVSPFHSIK